MRLHLIMLKLFVFNLFFFTVSQQRNSMRTFWTKKLPLLSDYSSVPYRRPTPLISFLIVLSPKTFLLQSPSINYWGKFPTQTNFFKQYTYADFFEIPINKRPVCIVLCFVSSCNEANKSCFVL